MHVAKNYLAPVTLNINCTFFDLVEKSGGRNASGESYPAKTVLIVRFDDVADAVSFKADEGTDTQKLLRSLGMAKRGDILHLTLERSFRIRTMTNSSGATWSQMIANDTLISAEIVNDNMDAKIDLFDENDEKSY